MKFENAGRLWAPEEHERLRAEFQAGTPLEEMALSHGRTPYALVGKLLALGLLVERGFSYYPVSPDPWMPLAQVRELANSMTQLPSNDTPPTPDAPRKP